MASFFIQFFLIPGFFDSGVKKPIDVLLTWTFFRHFTFNFSGVFSAFLIFFSSFLPFVFFSTVPPSEVVYLCNVIEPSYKEKLEAVTKNMGYPLRIIEGGITGTDFVN